MGAIRGKTPIWNLTFFANSNLFFDINFVSVFRNFDHNCATMPINFDACLHCYQMQFRMLLYDFENPDGQSSPTHRHKRQTRPAPTLLQYCSDNHSIFHYKSRYSQTMLNTFYSKTMTNFNSAIMQLLSNNHRKKQHLSFANFNTLMLFLVLIVTFLSQTTAADTRSISDLCPSGYQSIEPKPRDRVKLGQQIANNGNRENVETISANCIDIDECSSSLNNCQHHCHNTEGSFMCHCYPGFTLSTDGFSCETISNLTAMVSSGRKMYRVQFGKNISEGLQSSKLLFTAKSEIISFTVAASKNEIYYMERDGLWVFNTETLKTYRNKEDSPNATIPNAKLAFNWANQSLLIAMDVRILRVLDHAWEYDFYISKVNQQIGDFAIDPVQKLLFVTELGAQSKLTIHDLDSKQQLYDFKTPTNNYLQTRIRVSTNIYDSKIYLVNAAGSVYSCFIDQQVGNLSCTVEITQGNVTSQILHYGSSLVYLSNHQNLVVCEMNNCSKTANKFKLDFEPDEIVLWSKNSQMDPKHVPCDECEHECEVIDKWFSQCKCRPGFELHVNGKSCNDVNECDQDPNLCDQSCINVPGSYKCHCDSPNKRIGNDGRSCVAFMTSCEENLCSHGCVQYNDTSAGIIQVDLNSVGVSAKCTCPVGSHLEPDKQTCTGCRAGDNGGCSHGCEETGLDSFLCTCPEGFKLSTKDQKTCLLDKTELRLIAATDNDMRVFTIPDMSIVKSFDVKGVQSMSIDHKKRCIYFIGPTTATIGKLNLTDSKTTTLFSTNGYSFSSIAIDWSYDSVYVSESTTGAIYSFRVGNSEKDNSKVLDLVIGSLTKPRDLAIDSDTGELYFIAESSDRSGTKAKTHLMKFNLATNNLETLFNTSNATTSLTIDYLSERLYFSDLDNADINSFDISHKNNSENRSTSIVNLNDNVFKLNLQIVDDVIYTLDWDRSWKVVTFNKTSGKKLENLSKNKRTEIGKLRSMLIYHVTQPLNDRRINYGPCSLENGGCDHTCSTLQDNVVCGCYENFTLTLDGKTCKSTQLTNQEDYNDLEIVSRAVCEQNRHHCHHYADCLQDMNEHLTCKCKEGFYGDGFFSCRDESLKCNKDETVLADCGNHGHCEKQRTFGLELQPACVCESDWIGKNCLEYAGRKRRLKSPKPIPVTHVSTLQIVQISFLLTVSVLGLMLVGGVLIYRHRRNQAAQKLRMRQLVRNTHYNCEVFQSVNPKSPINYTEVKCPNLKCDHYDIQTKELLPVRPKKNDKNNETEVNEKLISRSDKLRLTSIVKDEWLQTKDHTLAKTNCDGNFYEDFQNDLSNVASLSNPIVFSFNSNQLANPHETFTQSQTDPTTYSDTSTDCTRASFQNELLIS